MTIDYLFRGFSKEPNQWIYGDLCTGLGNHKYIMPKCFCGEAIAPEYKKVMFGGWVKVEPESIGQFTRLTDKNSVKIFKDDVVKFYGEKTTPNHYVIFLNGAFGLYSNYDCMFMSFADMPVEMIESLQIIGNLYENPELIAGVK